MDTATDTEAGRLACRGGSVTLIQMTAVASSSTVTSGVIAANKTKEQEKHSNMLCIVSTVTHVQRATTL